MVSRGHPKTTFGTAARQSAFLILLHSFEWFHEGRNAINKFGSLGPVGDDDDTT